MKKVYFFILIISVLGMGMPAQAQIGRLLKEKAKEKAAKALEKRLEAGEAKGEPAKRAQGEGQQGEGQQREGQQREGQHGEGQPGQPQHEAGQNEAEQNLEKELQKAQEAAAAFGQNTESDPGGANEQYAFDYYFVMDLTSQGEEGDTRARTTFYFREDGKAYGQHHKSSPENGQGQATDMLMIADKENQLDLMVIATKKQVIVTAAEEGEDTGEMEEDQGPGFDIGALRKTGRTKKILGYTSHEYVYEDDSSRTVIWSAPDAADLAEKFSAREDGVLDMQTSWGQQEKGMLMELAIHDKVSQERFQSKMVAIETKKGHRFDLSGYKFVNLTQIGKGYAE